jgi:hypothetical protein
VATDPLGSLWMVPMTDVLKDIQTETSSSEVQLIKYGGFKDARSMDEPVRIALNEPRLSRSPPLSERDSSLVESWQQRQHGERDMKLTVLAPRSAKCQWCGFAKHRGPCSDILNRAGYSLKYRGTKNITYRWACHECGGDNSYYYSPRCKSGFCGHNVYGCDYCEIYTVHY